MTERKLTLSGGPLPYAVTLDGQDLSKGIRRLNIEVDPRGDWPRVEAELAIHAVEVTELGMKDPNIVVSMPDEARAALLALGWTTPETIDKIRDLREKQGRDGTWNLSSYMRGLYNGLELALSILEGERDPQFKDAPADDAYLCDQPPPDMSGPEYETVKPPASPGER